VSVESIALLPQCAECGKVWLPADSEHWEADLTDDEPPEVAFYCPSARSASLAATEAEGALPGAYGRVRAQYRPLNLAVRKPRA
jgi:hypothetical protein